MNDHINMRAATGKIKAVPIWQIKQWIGAGIFSLQVKTGNAVGYDFVDHAEALKDMTAYAQWEQAQAMRKRAAQAAPQAAEAGIAAVVTGKPRSADNPAFSATPENVEKPAEEPKAAPGRPVPKDMI